MRETRIVTGNQLSKSRAMTRQGKNSSAIAARGKISNERQPIRRWHQSVHGGGKRVIDARR
jgi:hypothetical protein